MVKGAAPAVLLAGLADELTLREAASATRLSVTTLRVAIRAGDLKAWIPRGKVPGRTGPKLGYRINKNELIRWFYGQAAVPAK